ncbi:hypothetical protein EIN_008970, partial [Entamoeba invadens IP1]
MEEPMPLLQEQQQNNGQMINAQEFTTFNNFSGIQQQQQQQQQQQYQQNQMQQQPQKTAYSSLTLHIDNLNEIRNDKYNLYDSNGLGMEFQNVNRNTCITQDDQHVDISNILNVSNQMEVIPNNNMEEEDVNEDPKQMQMDNKINIFEFDPTLQQIYEEHKDDPILQSMLDGTIPLPNAIEPIPIESNSSMITLKFIEPVQSGTTGDVQTTLLNGLRIIDLGKSCKQSNERQSIKMFNDVQIIRDEKNEFNTSVPYFEMKDVDPNKPNISLSLMEFIGYFESLKGIMPPVVGGEEWPTRNQEGTTGYDEISDMYDDTWEDEL